MPYIGNFPAESYSQVSYQDLTGGSGTSFTLDYPVGSAGEIEVFINNVRQEPTVAYTVSGTALTMTGSVSATDDFYVVFQGKNQQSIGIPEKQTDGTYLFSNNVTVNGNITSTGIDDNATSTAMTLDSSGNLLVGKTSAGYTIAGAQMEATGVIGATVNNNQPMFANRLSSDGSIFGFYKDGTAVGGIGSAGSGTELYIGGFGTNTNGIYFTNSNRIAPMKNMVVSDGTQDIGHPSYRWKDLYLSGGVVFGDAGGSGTPSSNTLDSYEEGTFSPQYLGSSSSPTVTYQYQHGRYVKVGNLVWINVRLRASSVSGGSGSLRVGNLPFNCNSGTDDYSSFNIGYVNSFTAADHPTAGFTTPGTNYINLIRFDSSDARDSRTASVLTSNLTNTSYVILAGVYSI